MMKFKLLILFIFVSQYINAEKIRVACVGNSITYGAFIPDRENNSYPAHLQKLLGNKYDVRNFGLSGSTVLEKGNMPYSKSSKYKEALDFEPNIVILKLGTNDSKAINWKYSLQFKNDYVSIINAFKEIHSKPRIILLTPLRCFLNEGNTSSINNNVIKDNIIPIIEEIAYEYRIELLNMHNMFGGKWDSDLLPDKIHPSANGSRKIAEKVYKYLLATSENINDTNDINIKNMEKKEFNFHGYCGFEFSNKDLKYLVVKPKFVAKGKPWLIRARFWGHEPQTDIELLENGFYITYCDVTDLYGAPKAVKRWDEFYKKMIKNGMSKKVVLEGMSRGGLIIYNWAAKNPDKVACIYADAPVMDIKSWPMGEWKSKGSDSDSRKMLDAYGFYCKEDALNWKKNPLDHVDVIVKNQISLLHVVGDKDEVVPVEENTKIFESNVKLRGGNIRVIHKKDVGHHPHSLFNPKEIVNFILNHTINKRIN